MNIGTCGTEVTVAEQKKDPKNLRIVLAGDLKSRWERLLSEKNITQQDAIEALVVTLLEQDDVAQSMLLRQVKATPELIEMVLRGAGERRYAELVHVRKHPPTGQGGQGAEGDASRKSHAPKRG